MRFATIAGANLTLAEQQDEYETIRVRKGVYYVPHGALLVPQPNLVGCMKCDPEDLERLNNGGPLYINILGTGWPPIGITTLDPALMNPSDGTA